MASTLNPDILVIDATMADIPLYTGFTYDRWKKGVNVMIEKTIVTSMWKNCKSSCCLRQISTPTTSGLGEQYVPGGKNTLTCGQTIQQLEIQIGNPPIPQQTTILQLCLIPMSYGSSLLQQCKKLL